MVRRGAGSEAPSTDSSTDVCAKVYGLPTVSEQCGYVKDRCIDSLNDAYSAHLLEYYFCNPPVIKALVGVAAVLLLVGTDVHPTLGA